MILGFKTVVGGKPTHFKEKILAPYVGELGHFRPKIHTIRSGFRWRKGMAIHMATGVRTTSYHQFNKGISELQTCTGTQDILIDGTDRVVYLWGTDVLPGQHSLPNEQCRLLSPAEVLTLAQNDGFESMDGFFAWFREEFVGQVVHWTGVRY